MTKVDGLSEAIRKANEAVVKTDDGFAVQHIIEKNPEFSDHVQKAFDAYNEMDQHLAAASVRVDGDHAEKFKAARATVDRGVNQMIKMVNSWGKEP